MPGTHLSGQQIRDMLNDELRAYIPSGGGKVNGVIDQVRDNARRAGHEVDTEFWRAVTEHMWTLARSGMLAIMPRDRPVIPGDMPQDERQIPTFFITELGKRVLRDANVSPYDWAKYQTTVQTKVSSPDSIVMVHLGEAVHAWQSGLYRGSAVMLGCAVERLIIMLAEALRDAPGMLAPAQKLGPMLKNPRVGISEVYEVVRDVLANLTEDKKLPGALADAWERRLTAAFEHTRTLRNRSGHPTGDVVSNDDAHSGLLLFPGVYEFVDRLIASLPKAAAPSAPPPAPALT